MTDPDWADEMKARSGSARAGGQMRVWAAALINIMSLGSYLFACYHLDTALAVALASVWLPVNAIFWKVVP